MTLPLGYTAGIVVMVALLKLGVGGRAAVGVTAVAALAGYLARIGAVKTALAHPLESARAAAPAALAAAGGFVVAIAPVVGSGRAGVLGYVLNNDPAVHSTIVELLRDHGTDVAAYGSRSSTTEVGVLVESGYPLGSHVWPLFAGVASAMDTFYVWAPSVAVAAAMLSLVGFASLRRLSIARWPAAAAAALVPAGYLVYSFIGQGSAKEIATAVAVYAAVAIAVELWDGRWSARSVGLLAVAPLAAFLTFGAGAAAWLAAPAVVLLVIALRRRSSLALTRRAAAVSLVALAIVAIAMTPLVLDAADYVRSSDSTLRDTTQPGNLLGAIPWKEAFNVWFAYDYRADPATFETLSTIVPWLAVALAAGGIVVAFRRRDLTLPLMVLAGVTAVVVISLRYSIYVEAKAYAVLAPALAISIAAALLALLGSATRRLRLVGAVLATAAAAAVLAGAGLVYAGAWLTPKDRFEELGEIADRLRGEGPILVNEREEWTYYLLRDQAPTESWGSWQPERGLMTGEPRAPLLPHTPDFDDYYPRFLQRFPLLLERKGPGGSRPPTNYVLAFETDHYRIWRRQGAAPAIHHGFGSDGYDYTARVDCTAPQTHRLFRASRRTGRPLVAAVPASRPKLIIGPDAWRGYEPAETPPPSGFITRRGGGAIVDARLRTGHYDAWLQGSFGPGVRLRVGDTTYGAAFDDLGLASAWHWLGRVSVPTRALPIALATRTEPLWRAGSKRSDTTGRLVFVPHPGLSRPVTVPPDRAQSLCGRRLDWIELPGG